MFLLIFLVAASGFSTFKVYHDLGATPYTNFTKWSTMWLRPSHNERQPTQPPNEWRNVTFEIPKWAKSMQMTSCTETLCIEPAERIPYYFVGAESVNVSIIWWGPVWQLHTGWGF